MVSSGGSIVEAAALTNGQLLIGSASAAPVAANISGTANQVTVTNGTGTITLSIPSAVILTGASSINSSSSMLAIGDSVTTTLTLGRAGQTTSLPATISMPNLTASLPLQLNASNNVISAAINLASSQVTGTLPPANGGTGSTATLANGQLLIGNGTTTPAAANITGTTNQVIVTNGAGTITLSLPQNIHTAATPTFASQTLSAVTNQLTLGTTNTTTISANAPVASRTYTIPETGANSSFVMTDGNQTINGNKTISGTTNLSNAGLTASLPLQLDGSKNIVTAAINLTTQVTGTLPPANGGTGSTATLANGQLLIGNGTTTPTASTITGTANQVTVTNGTGTITLSIPSAVILTGASSINSSSSTLAIGDSVTTTLTLGRTGQAVAVASTLNVDSGVIDRTAAGTLSIGGTNVTTLTLGRAGQTTSLPATISVPNLTASLPLQLNASNNVVSAAINLATQVTGTLPPANGGTGSTATLANGQLLIGNGTITPTASTITGTANQVTVTNGAGTITLSIPSAVILTGASSINSSSSTLAIGDSVTTTLTLGRTGQSVAVPSNLSISGPTTTTNSITLNATNELRFADTDSSNYVGFKSPEVVAANTVWTLPNVDGTVNQTLTTNGAGTLSWQTGGTLAAETYDYLPFPTLAHLNGSGTRVGQTVFNGGMYTLLRDVTLSKITFNATAFTAPGTLSMYFFQTADGTAAYSTHLASRVAGLTSRTIATGNNTLTLDAPGSATLKAGNLYVLWGRASATGTFTLATFTNFSLPLFDATLATGQASTAFTTTISATTTPATFDPTAATVTASIIDIQPLMRFTNF